MTNYSPVGLMPPRLPENERHMRDRASDVPGATALDPAFIRPWENHVTITPEIIQAVNQNKMTIWEARSFFHLYSREFNTVIMNALAHFVKSKMIREPQGYVLRPSGNAEKSCSVATAEESDWSSGRLDISVPTLGGAADATQCIVREKGVNVSIATSGQQKEVR